jgi:hypothetical protein
MSDGATYLPFQPGEAGGRDGGRSASLTPHPIPPPIKGEDVADMIGRHQALCQRPQL